MKLTLLFFLTATLLNAQNNFKLAIEDELSLVDDYSLNHYFSNYSKNLVKISFPILNLPAISLQYERNIYKKITAGAAINYVSEQEFFFLKTFTKQKISNDFAREQLRNIKTTIFSFTPEARIYFGKDKFKGFYIGTFVRFSNYNVSFPLEYIENELAEHYQRVTFSGKFKTVTFGLSIGAQWNIYKDFYLDWLIVGPHIGNATEKLFLNSNLDPLQQRGITKSLELIKTALTNTSELPDIDFDYKVSEKGSEVNIKNPWAGMRLQVGIGYRF